MSGLLEQPWFWPSVLVIFGLPIALVLLTEWQKFRDADPEMMGVLVRGRRVVDGRHALDADAYRAAGWDYRALGRPAQSGTVTLVEDVKDALPTTA